MALTTGAGPANGRLGCRNGMGATAAVLAALSLESSEGVMAEPSKHSRQRSKTHEEEMDENKVVVHTRRGSTAVGVTPSDPSAIVDLFQEVESIGSIYPGHDSDESEHATGGEEAAAASGDHAGSKSAAAAAASAASDLGGSAKSQRRTSANSQASACTQPLSACSRDGDDDNNNSKNPTPSSATPAPPAPPPPPAPPAGTQQIQQQRSKGWGMAGKLWTQLSSQKKQPRTPPQPADGGAVFEPALGTSVGAPQAAPQPYWPSKATAADVTTEGGVGAVAMPGGSGGAAQSTEGNQKGGQAAAAGAEGRLVPGLGKIQRIEARGKLIDSESAQSAQQSAQEVYPPSSSALPTASVSDSVESQSNQKAPFRRKTSMGSFQKGMGESLTGRLRKQLDIPKTPKREINTDISIAEIQNLSYLAQGAMCVAYTALLNGQMVVLKTPLPNTSHAAVAANDLEVEMLLLKELHHDNIVSLLGAGFLPDGRRFVALEYLSGGTLSEVLREHQAEPMGISKVLDLSLALCNALEYLHDVAVPGRIVCHRDLKPDNIGFAADGTLKVIDFGLGKIIKRRFRVKAEKYQMTGGTGSLRYMAPEIADHQEYNEKGDVYSFSLIMWEMLAGTKPFLGLKRPDFYNRVVDQGERPPLNPDWPLPIRNLLESCWRTNLDERLSFREVAGILKVCAEEENRRSFSEEKRKSLVGLSSIRRSRMWTTTGARPDLDEISADPQYKPKFKISSLLSSHHSTGGVRSTMERLRGTYKHGGKGRAEESSVFRTTSDDTDTKQTVIRRRTINDA